MRGFGGTGNEPGLYQQPFGVAIDPTTGNIVICDSGNKRVQVFSSYGDCIRVFADAGTFRVENPHAVLVDREGKIAISNSGFSPKVQIWSNEGKHLGGFGSWASMKSPVALGLDRSGNVLVGCAIGGSCSRLQVYG